MRPTNKLRLADRLTLYKNNFIKCLTCNGRHSIVPIIRFAFKTFKIVLLLLIILPDQSKVIKMSY